MTVSPASWEPLDDMSLTELAKLASSRNSIRKLVDAIFTANNLSPHIVVEIDSLHADIAAAQSGIGITAICDVRRRRDSLQMFDTTR
jgi:DNA-binding transcriptional LysR family regulator